MLKAATNIILEDGKDSLVIKNVRIIEGKNGLFMSLPARRNVKNEFKEICYPLSAVTNSRRVSADTRQDISSARAVSVFSRATRHPRVISR